MPHRFALAGISCECNGFAAGETETAYAPHPPVRSPSLPPQPPAPAHRYFEQTGFLLAGPAMLSLRETSAEIGGAIDLLTRVGGDSAELVPLLGARANSAAPLSNACWDELRGGVLDRLEAALEAGPIDGVLLAMHGNMCVGNVPGQPVDLDPEGTLAADVRALVGAATTIVMTVDLHANVTPLMVEHLDGCISYDHYPHDDIFRTVSPDARFR